MAINKIPGFVRGKIKRNTEKFARDRNLSEITVEAMYAAKKSVGAQCTEYPRRDVSVKRLRNIFDVQ
ncbi:MAG: hypothetical protein LH702_28960 [Phormidesmis sp. CAN_BIN44]|nr:hypothetical protein [Phormidesmis sp. CAN_BIN44]